MRLIDADKFKKLYESYARLDTTIRAKDILEDIDNMPTIEPQPEISLDESCTDCPLYDKDRHSCPRFNKVIPEVLREVMAERRQDEQTD